VAVAAAGEAVVDGGGEVVAVEAWVAEVDGEIVAFPQSTQGWLSLSWLHNRRRLLLRTDRRDDVHESFLALACCLICWRRLERPIDS